MGHFSETALHVEGKASSQEHLRVGTVLCL